MGNVAEAESTVSLKDLQQDYGSKVCLIELSQKDFDRASCCQKCDVVRNVWLNCQPPQGFSASIPVVSARKAQVIRAQIQGQLLKGGPFGRSTSKLSKTKTDEDSRKDSKTWQCGAKESKNNNGTSDSTPVVTTLFKERYNCRPRRRE